MDRWQAQQAFWSSFGVPAVRETDTLEPDDIDGFFKTYGAYITYEAAAGGFGADILVNASIWTRSSIWLQADTLADAVEARLGGRGGGGYVQRYDGGGIWITAEDNFAQGMEDSEDDMIKRKVLSVVLRFG